MRRILCTLMLLLPILLRGADRYPITLYHIQQTYPPALPEIRLKHRFLIPNSETIITGGIHLMREVDYRIHYIDGLVSFNRPPEDSIYISYDIFPFKLRKSYYHRRYIEEATKSDTGIVKEIPALPADEETPFKFKRSGSIFRSVTIGSNRDASLESGMDLKLNGRLGKGTTITAVLSDRNIPIQPEGDTRNLEEIDKVYVNIESQYFGLNLGDYDLSIGEREFASLNRKLTGAQVYTKNDDYSAMISGASSKGEFRSQMFNGIEGLQGPYILNGKNGESGILVLAGTEKVWLDGQLLTRGEDYDYIIDYSRGELTFTEKRPIDSDSRIVVDFQYASGDYSRSLYHSTGRAELLRNKLTLYYAIASESDNKENPLSFTFDNNAKSILQSVGDNQQAAQVEGGEFVGYGEGDYNISYNPDSSFIYVWAGRDSGEYDVTFSFVGPEQGDYTRLYSPDGEIYYEYTGEGQGSYSPVIELPLPRLEQSADIAIEYNPTSKISANIEAAGTKYDRNTYSDIDDNDNNDFAVKMQLKADTIALPMKSIKLIGGLNLKARAVGENFHPLDRTEEAEYNRKWGYADTLSMQEESLELRGYIVPANRIKIASSGGIMRKKDYDSKRFDTEFMYHKPDTMQILIFGENISSNYGGNKGFWRRGQAEGWRWFGNIKTALRWEGEDQSQSGNGFRFEKYQISGKFGRDRGLLVEHLFRRDEIRANSALSNLSKLNRTHLNLQGGRNSTNYTIDYSHSERRYDIPDSSDVITDLGKIRFDTRSNDGFASMNIQHRITQSQTAENALIPIEVGWGEGNYIKEGEQYFPDPNGNYLLISQPTGNYIRSAKVNSSINLRFDLRRKQDIVKQHFILSQLTTETYFALTEESTTEEPWKLYLLYLPEFRSDSTLYGTSTFRQDVYYRKGDRDFSARLRFNDNRSLNNRLVGVGERLVRDLYSLWVWRTITNTVSLQPVLSYSIERKWLADTINRNLTFYKIENTIIKQISRSLEFRILMQLETAEDAVEEISSLSVTIRPQADYSIFRRGRITAECQWTAVYSDDDYLPYEMTRGRGKGSNYEWSLRAAFRVGKNLNLTMNYNGESKIGRPVIHTGRMELRAFF